MTRFTLLVTLNGKDTLSVVTALPEKIKTLPHMLRTTLTWERAMELALHKPLAIDTGIQVYFCEPKSPWQRGTNQNTNGLIRQYLPPNTDLSCYTQHDLERIARALNERPRKTLQFHSPMEKLNALVALNA